MDAVNADNSRSLAANREAHSRVAGTIRIEAFSDGVTAIIVTLLIFEVRVPALDNLSSPAVWAALGSIAPKFISFAISFFTVAIFWVNHHHFFHRIIHSDWKLLWLNNLLLFWLTVVPFTTAFLGDYPTQPVAVSLYAFTLCMAGLSFSAMGYYAYFRGSLVAEGVPLEERRREWYRSWAGVALYGLASAIAFVYVYASLVIVTIIPFVYVVPSLLRQDAE